MTTTRSCFASAATLAALLGACGPAGGPTGDASTGDGSVDTMDASDGARPAGSLVGVNVTSQVGVLLEDFPMATRARAATQLTALPDAFWIERAKLQLRLAGLRLVYRGDYYPEADHRNALTLPPEEKWEITLSGRPARATVDGHDVVSVSFTMRSTLLSDEASPGVTEPMLANVGGSWREEFVFPVDPTMILQRTGYACIDEAQFPPDSVDAENAYEFYDDACEVETAENASCHLTLPRPTESCVDAVQRAVGRVNTTVNYERLAWDSALADRARAGAMTTADAPDLAVVTTGYQSLSTNRVIYKYISPNDCSVVERCVSGSGWRRLLAFDSIDHNQGGRPVHIGPVDYAVEGLGSDLISHNVYQLSECHHHYHFQFYGSFSYGSGSDARIQKNGFCLETTGRLSNNEYSPLHTQYNCANQGVEPGWVDLYAAGLVCNWVDVTSVDTSRGPVTNNLEFHSNPDHFMCEGTPTRDAMGNQAWQPTEFRTASGAVVDRPLCTQAPGTEANDIGTVPVTLPQRGGMMSSACRDPQLNGPLRNCGFAQQPTMPTCTPGATVTLRCSGGTAMNPQVVRVCETSRVLGQGVDCSHREALANAVNEDGSTTVTFTCPMPRTATAAETGGQYAIYTAPVLTSDTALPVTCAPMP